MYNEKRRGSAVPPITAYSSIMYGGKSYSIMTRTAPQNKRDQEREQSNSIENQGYGWKIEN